MVRSLPASRSLWLPQHGPSAVGTRAEVTRAQNVPRVLPLPLLSLDVVANVVTNSKKSSFFPTLGIRSLDLFLRSTGATWEWVRLRKKHATQFLQSPPATPQSKRSLDCRRVAHRLLREAQEAGERVPSLRALGLSVSFSLPPFPSLVLFFLFFFVFLGVTLD